MYYPNAGLLGQTKPFGSVDGRMEVRPEGTVDREASGVEIPNPFCLRFSVPPCSISGALAVGSRELQRTPGRRSG